MAKFDHSKGGHYEPDPARVQRSYDFDQPDDMTVKGKRKKGTSVWLNAMKGSPPRGHIQ